jgi:hypothetical protein
MTIHDELREQLAKTQESCAETTKWFQRKIRDLQEEIAKQQTEEPSAPEETPPRIIYKVHSALDNSLIGVHKANEYYLFQDGKVSFKQDNEIVAVYAPGVWSHFVRSEE